MKRQLNKLFKIVILVILVINISFVYSHEEETFALAEEIIKQKIICDELSENQLEILGDYYMEQMHPGELHEIMDERMGGEGSESLRQVHINMGLAFYCGEHGRFSSGMMNMMMGRTGFNMMRYNVPSKNYYTAPNYNLFWIPGVIFMILILVIIVSIIVLLAKSSSTNKMKRGKNKHDK